MAYSASGLTLSQIAEILRDGKRYEFWSDGLKHVFHKAPFPSTEYHNKRDGACSAITYRQRHTGQMASPVLLLAELTDPVWDIKEIKE